MTITTFSSRDFNQDTGSAKKAALEGPVFITDRGKPAHVLLTFDAYQRLACGRKTIGELLAMPEGADTDIEFPKLSDVSRDADLS